MMMLLPLFARSKALRGASLQRDTYVQHLSTDSARSVTQKAAICGVICCRNIIDVMRYARHDTPCCWRARDMARTRYARMRMPLLRYIDTTIARRERRALRAATCAMAFFHDADLSCRFSALCVACFTRYMIMPRLRCPRAATRQRRRACAICRHYLRALPSCLPR